jgi:hypothetical protein
MASVALTPEPEVRSSAPPSGFAAKRQQPYRVVAHGLTYFCRKLPDLLNSHNLQVFDRSQHDLVSLWNLFRDLRRCDLAFSWGGRLDMGPFLQAVRSLRVPKVVIFWCGSDILRSNELAKDLRPDPWILKQIHWAASPSLAEEVRALGVHCEYVQASFVPQIAKPAPLPREFSVLVFLPTPRLADLYGWDLISAAARALPHVTFNLVGLREGILDAPPNVHVHRWIDDLSSLYRDSSVLWRPVRHDAGIAFMVLEALSHGRHVLYTYPIQGARRVSGLVDSIQAIQELFDAHHAGGLSLNQVGIDSVAQTYSREVVREELQRRWSGIIDNRSSDTWPPQ